MRDPTSESIRLVRCMIGLAFFLLCSYNSAQSIPTASRTILPSVFIGVTGTSTGLEAGHNFGVTAGLDCALPIRQLLAAVEVRGSYPVDSGSVVGEKSFGVGLRVQKPLRWFWPYADLLIGRGELNYQGGGYPIPAQNVAFLQSFTTVYSDGVGFETSRVRHYGVLVDFQVEHWDVPFGKGSLTSGSLRPIVGTVGLVYQLGD